MSEVHWLSHIQDAIRQHQIHTIRLCVQDTSNVARSRYMTARYFLEQMGGGELSFPSALFSFDTSAAIHPSLGEGFAGGYPSWKVVPDLRSFSVLPYAPGVARLIADVFDVNGDVVEYAPRQVLRKVLRRFEEVGFRVRGSFEYEFYVFRRTNEGLIPAWTGLQCFAENKQAEVDDIIMAVLHNLNDMGAGPEMANTEYGSGQFEVSNSPFWGIEIADMAFYYRLTIKELLAKRGYVTSFMSKPNTHMSGSGAHLHHSLYDGNGNNLFFDPENPDGLSEMCRWFIGGQLHHARALTALACSTVNSYKRLQPYSFAPCTKTWGFEHRGTLIRVPRARGESTRLENRLPGADTDPYVTLAAILAAGLDGIERQIEPPAPLRNEDAYAKVWERLPRTPEEGVRALEEDEWAHDALGSQFIDHIVQLRKSEYERFLQHVTDWEIESYRELF